jgi:hypothetical protein
MLTLTWVFAPNVEIKKYETQCCKCNVGGHPKPNFASTLGDFVCCVRIMGIKFSGIYSLENLLKKIKTLVRNSIVPMV